MKVNVRLLRKKRRYSASFKKQLVSDFESGHYSVVQLSRLHGVSRRSIYRWIYQLSTFNEKGYRIVEHQKSSSERVRELEARIRDLEGLLGRKQIMIDYLEKLIELANEELDIDIKKKLRHPAIQYFRKHQGQMSCSLNQLYQTIGISKQAVAQYAHRQYRFEQQVRQLILEVDELRAEHPGCGVAKMYYILRPEFIGRDRFVALLMQLGYRLKRPRNYQRTTRAGPHYYPNLIKGKLVDAPAMIWQSDITYWRIGECFYYLVFIIDVYSKVIVGYQVSDHLRAQANVAALRMALAHFDAPMIHHSDRGSQYTYKPYVQLLQQQGAALSMGLRGQDNAYAERINRTIKEEYLEHWQPSSLSSLRKRVSRAVDNYNHVRVHNHLGKRSPMAFMQDWSLLPREQRPIITIFSDHFLT